MKLFDWAVKHWWWLLTAALCAASAAVVFLPSQAERLVKPPTIASVRIATPSQPGAGLVHVALSTDTFARHRLRAASEPVFSGSKALEALLQGKADLAVVPDTPFVMATMRGEALVLLATIHRSRRSLALIARADRHIGHPQDLAGKRIGVPFGTTAQFFLDTMMLVHGVRESDAQVANVHEEHLMAALRAGTIDAAAVWNLHLAQPDDAGNGVPLLTFHGEELYSYHLNLVTTQDYIARNRVVVERVLHGLRDAMQQMQADPATARKIIARNSHISSPVLETTFDPSEFVLQLDNSLLMALDDQSRWTLQRRLLSVRPLPNYLHHIDAAPLHTVAPSSVTIIR